MTVFRASAAARLSSAIAATALLSLATGALATSETSGDTADHAFAPSAAAVVVFSASRTRVQSDEAKPSAEAPVVRVGYAHIGKPVYFARSAGPGTGSIVRMSSQPMRIRSSAGSTQLISRSPVLGAFVTSGFGQRRHPILGGHRMHQGIDLAARAGTPVGAAQDGVVTRSEWVGGYGLLIALDHSEGRETRYAHLSRLNVAVGQRVQKGQIIGFVGSTGRSTGAHLHFETRVNGRPIKPQLK